MCGRYSLASPDPARLRERFAIGDAVPVRARYNVAPGDDVLAVTTDREGEPRGELLRWGLVPYWAKDPKTLGLKLINARVGDDARPTARFRDARRCLVVADGFYEWEKRPGEPKQPWWVTRPDHEPFAFAGLWSSWRPADGVEPLRTVAIVTTRGLRAAGARARPHAGDAPARGGGRLAGPRHRARRAATSCARRSSRPPCARSATRSTTRATTSPTACEPALPRLTLF